MEAGAPCGLCGIILDSKGFHALSCMSGGDQVHEHNAIRDVTFDYCERGQLRPSLEHIGLLTGSEDPTCRDRPADVLVIPHVALARALPDGSRALRTERVCFDFAVVNALGPGRWDETSQDGGGAAEAYDQTKRRRNNTEERCTTHGLRFWLVVLTHQGGTSKAADSAFRAIAKAVAEKEGRDEASIRREMQHRIAIVLARSRACRVLRRVRVRNAGRPAWAGAVGVQFEGRH